MRRSLFILAFALLPGCSLLLDWDPDQLPCADTMPRCSDGFSCLGEVCQADGVVERHGQCTEDRQCQPGLDCRGFACVEPCGQAFYIEAGDACVGDEYCAPFENPSGGAQQGYCVLSECRENFDCQDGSLLRTCVPIKVGAGACLSTCEVGFNPTYTDNCVVEAGGSAVYCQAIGRDNPNFGAQLVCLDAGVNIEGQPCNPVINPCQEGFICDLTQSTPECRQYCDVTNDLCDGGDICCPRQYGQAIYGVCAPNCGT
ncbi:MAG: hypothetical protein AAFQ82_09700 [Myxococcota bacterium]